MSQQTQSFWSVPSAALFQQLQVTPAGLSSAEAGQRLIRYGSNLLKPKKRTDSFSLLVSQFKSPLILILACATVLSFFLHDSVDAFIILTIIIISGLLGFWQERGAANAVEKLLAIVKINATALRDGQPTEIPVEQIVPGDTIIFNAGDVVPGECLIIESKDLFVDEATLTGETYPVEKTACVLEADTSLAQRHNALWMGTHIISGSAKALVIHTGKETEFGKVSERLKLRPQETDFEHGVRRFGYFLMEVTLILVIIIFAFNVYLKKPVLDSFLFSMAIAVGLTPQLLPAIISINLSHGAKRMARNKVIVKRLAAIENFGSMNVLCSDKTGTLTEGTVRLQSAFNIEGTLSEKALFYAYLNAIFETGFTNPIDQAIRRRHQFDVTGYNKLDEVPYDFIRKRLSILIAKDDMRLMVTKGALSNVLEVCSSAETDDGTTTDMAAVGEKIQRHFQEYSSQGFRTLGIAYKNIAPDSTITKDNETKMTFLGLLVFMDPPKPLIDKTIESLKALGTSLKIITGDNQLVAGAIWQQIGLAKPRIFTGPELRRMSDEALINSVKDVDIFAEVEPNQKERIILALRKAGNVVGYMGDGINDASALHAADVGISVNTAVDVAKDAADIVLLENDLSVLVKGVQEGRMTFANTLKYVFMATSANFGNMFSMSGASLLLPFLPLLPKQILLTNLMTDFPEMTIATDSVDDELVERPRRWDIGFIRRFMITFGIVSSVFDYLTFGALLWILHATHEQFRTAWLLESVISASLIVLVIRSRKPIYKSAPGKYLLFATLLVVAVTLLLPYTPLARPFELEPLSLFFYLTIGVIVGLYVITAEMVKRRFYAKEHI